MAFGDDERLDRSTIHRIDHEIKIRREQAIHIRFSEELDDAVHAARRMDLRHARGQHIHLGNTNGMRQRRKLAIRVGDADVIHVDQRQLANATAHQRLHDPRTHSANTYNGHMRSRKTRQRRSPIKPPNATEALRVRFIHAIV